MTPPVTPPSPPVTPPSPSPSPSSGTPGSPSPSAASDNDWTTQAVDVVESVVGLVRDRATIPLRTAARALVYGLTLSVVAVALVIGIIDGAVRVLTVYLPVGRGPDGGHRVWVAYLIVGGICALAGLLLLRKAESAGAQPK